MKANKLLIMVLLIGSSFLMSCMPWVYNYYRPEAEGGTVKKSMCGGEIGPKDMIVFSIDEVTISIKANEIQDGIKFAIDIRIPKGNEVRIHTSLIEVSIPLNGSTYEGFLNPQNHPDGSSWQIGDCLVGETTELRTVYGTKITWDKLFRINAIINMSESEMIELTLPTFYINNKQLDLPEITFSKDKSYGLFPLNC
jgi:hypothetical protein